LTPQTIQMRHLAATSFVFLCISFFYTVGLCAAASAQSAPPQNTNSPAASISITVTDDTGVAVASARISLVQPPLTSIALHCETDFSGRCQFLNLATGNYDLHVEKEGFYALTQSSVAATPGAHLDVTLQRQQEVREVVNVVESPPAIDRTQVSSQETLSGLDVINILYPGTNDYRNVLNFIPGVVQDNTGQPHIAGSETYQTVTLLDGFNITQPANGQVLARVSTDAFRSIKVEPAREPAEFGKGSGGVLSLNTGIGDDHFRFFGTDFIPSWQDKGGWKFDQFLPRLTFSGPLKKGKVWFYNALDGEYDNIVYTELPPTSDNDYVLRIGNLTKLQANLTNRNILTTSFLADYLHDQYAYLSPQNPQQANPKDVESAYIGTIKDQHYFAGGQLLETGFAYDEYNLQLTPYGDLPYFLSPNTATGSYYAAEKTQARRWQILSNLYLPPREWHGHHDFKFGVDLDRIAYDAQFERQPISFLTATAPIPLVNETCLTAPQTADFPCTRYSTFTPAPLHDEFNSEISAYAEDRWLVTDRLLVEPGIRLDWDQVFSRAVVSPRLAGTYILDNSGNTKFSAGVGLVYDATPIFLIARPYAGTREDTFFSVPDSTCTANCVVTSGPVDTTFTADPNKLHAPGFLNWSVGLEKKLPKAIYLKSEFIEKRGTNGYVYDTPTNSAAGDFILENKRDDRYDAFQVNLRRNFRESYMLMVSYTRSRTRSNEVLDFNVDSPLLSRQLPGAYPWDTPNRFLSWGYFPLFKLPLFKQFEVAYSMEARTGFPFNETNDQQQLLGAPDANRFPEYFSLNLQLEKRFHLFGYYWALRGGFDNITNHPNPYVVNATLDSLHTTPTFFAFQGRAFTSRIRLLGRH
jgi:hypothetical protein